MNENINGGSDLAAHRRQGQICPHQGHGLQTGQHVPGAVAMAGRKAAGMARIQGLEHIQAFFPPDFTYDDPISPNNEKVNNFTPGTLSIFQSELSCFNVHSE